MTAIIARNEDIEQLANFLATCNAHNVQNIGYIGSNKEEILLALKEDFLQQNGELNFAVMKDKNQNIIGAIGLDIDDSSAEVWGPFSKNNELEIENELWDLLTLKFPYIKKFHFFINLENKKQQTFVNQIGAKNTGEHRILSLKREHFKTSDNGSLEPFEMIDFNIFEQLHNEAFPNTYYDAKTIISRISKNHRLFILKNNNELIGYAYFEVEPEFCEANLEYIAIHSDYQNQGYGTKILNEVLNKIFKYPEINDLILCVSNQNSQANRVYEKVGFENKSELFSYTFSRI